MEKSYIYSSVFLLAGFVFSLFFTGSDSALFAPMINCIFLAAFFAVKPNLKSGWAIPKTGTIIWFVLFYSWLWLGTLWSTVPYISAYFAFIFSIIPILLLSYVSSPNLLNKVTKQTEYLLKAFGIIWAAIILGALIQFFFFFETHGPRIHLPLLSPNNLAALLNIGLVIAFGLFLLSTNKKDCWLRGTFIVLGFAALFVTQSRGGFICLGFGIFLLTTLVNYKDKVVWKKTAILIPFLLIIPLLFNSYNLRMHSDIPVTEQNVHYDAKPINHTGSIKSRLSIWQASADMIKDKPIVGFGLSTFNFHYPRYRSVNDQFSSGHFAHMDPLQFAVEMGVPILILFYGFLCAALWRTITSLKKCGNNFEKRMKILIPFCAMVTVIAHAHIDFHLYMPVILIPLSCLLIYWYAVTENIDLVEKNNSIKLSISAKHATLFLTLSILITLSMMIWPTRATIGQLYFNKTHAGLIQDTQASSATQDALRKAKLISPRTHWAQYEYEARLKIKDFGQNVHRMKKIDAENSYQDILNLFEQARIYNPYFFELDFKEANIHYLASVALNDQNAKEKVFESLQETLRKNPGFLPARLKLADFHERNGDLESALEILEPGMKRMGFLINTNMGYLARVANLRLQTNDYKGYQALAYKIQKKKERLQKRGILYE